MTSPPLVSIIIPCFIRSAQDAGLLDDTLATVDRQNWPNYEVIVVDDGSPYDIAAGVALHPRTTTLRQGNAGSALARNAGIARMQGEYVIFLDADDHLLPGAIETAVHQLASHPECGFAVGPREEMTYEGNPVPWPVPPPPPPPPGGRIYNALLGFEWYIIPPSSAIFRREAVDRVGGFRNPWGADDLDFYLRMARLFPAWCYQSPAVTRYRRYSASSSRDGERMLNSIRAVYDRERPFVTGNAAAEQAFNHGLARLTEIFVDCLVENIEDRVRARQWRRAARSALILAQERPRKLAAVLRHALSPGSPA